MVGAAKMGINFSAVAPGSLQPDPELAEQAMAIAGRTGARLTTTDDLDAGAMTAISSTPASVVIDEAESRVHTIKAVRVAPSGG